jgi:hypothetical protein
MSKKIIQFTLQKQKTSKNKSSEIKAQILTELEVDARALNDPDNLPLTKTQLSNFRPVKNKN